MLVPLVLNIVCQVWVGGPCDSTGFIHSLGDEDVVHAAQAEVSRFIPNNTGAVLMDLEKGIQEIAETGVKSFNKALPGGNEDSWEHQEFLHELHTYQPDDVLVYICSICVQDGQTYLWMGNNSNQTVPGGGVCVSTSELDELYEEPGEDVVVAFSVIPVGCYNLLLNLFVMNNTTVPDVFHETYGLGYDLLEEITWTRNRRSTDVKVIKLTDVPDLNTNALRS